MTTTKELVDRLLQLAKHFPGSDNAETAQEAADALERLTQPVGVEPRRYTFDTTLELVIPHESGEYATYAEYAETVARLQAEGAAMSADISGISDERDVLQEQVNVLRDALNEAALVISHFETSCDADSETLPMVMEALAATEKEKTE